MPEFYVKVCDECMLGRKIGDTFSVDVKNIKDNWEPNAPCDICTKHIYEFVFTVESAGKIGDIPMLKIIGVTKKD